MRTVVTLILIILLSTTMLLAQEKNRRKSKSVDIKEHNVVKEDGKTVVYKKKTVVDFEGSMIEGEVKNPNELYFVHRPQEKFNSLVKKRPNFHQEMLRDSVMIR